MAEILDIGHTLQMDKMYGATVVKLAQSPEFGDPLPKRLLEMLESDKEMFLKGVKAESVRRQRPWDRYSSGLRERFCSS